MSQVPPGSQQQQQQRRASTAIGSRAQFDLAFQIAPIILKGGIASNVQGGLLPINQLTPTKTYANAGFAAAAQQAGLIDTDEPFARFVPLPGSTLISQSVGMYPFANQSIAANATIQQPLTISLAMIAPVNQRGGYLTKLHAFSALQAALAKHNASGGTYVIATPAFVYMDVIMTAMTDITPEIEAEDAQKQLQIQYQLDFIQPIVTQAQAATAQSALMQKITNGSQINGTPSWSGNTSSSPANQTGVTGALGNVVTALETFGGAV